MTHASLSQGQPHTAARNEKLQDGQQKGAEEQGIELPKLEISAESGKEESSDQAVQVQQAQQLGSSLISQVQAENAETRSHHPEQVMTISAPVYQYESQYSTSTSLRTDAIVRQLRLCKTVCTLRSDSYYCRETRPRGRNDLYPNTGIPSIPKYRES